MACTHKDSCALFPVISLNSALQIWQTFYCDGKHETCQRFQRSAQGQKVPANLLPNGKLLDLVEGIRPAVQANPTSQPADIKQTATPSATAHTAPINPAQPIAVQGTDVSYYLRVRIKNIPGLAEKIVQEIRNLGIRIDGIINKPVHADGTRCLIVITDFGPEVELFRAILRIEALEGVVAKVKSVALERPEATQATGVAA